MIYTPAMFQVSILFALLLVPVKANLEQNRTYTRLILDDMSSFFGEGDEYPSQDFDELVQCFHKWDDDDLERSQDSFWEQMVTFYQTSNSSKRFYWNSFADANLWLEDRQNKTGIFGSGNRTYHIESRCNYASNMAYYRSALRVCDYKDWNVPIDHRKALKRIFSVLAFSSAFFHGCSCDPGGEFDVRMGSMGVYAAYRLGTQSIESSNFFRTLLLDESIDPIPITQLADNVTQMVFNLDIQDWYDFLRTLPFNGDTFTNAGATILFTCAVILPFGLCRVTVLSLLEGIEDIDPKFLEDYVKELEGIIDQEDFPISIIEGVPLLVKTLSVISIFVYGWLWQEQTLDTPFMEGYMGSNLNSTTIGEGFAPYFDILTTFFSGIKNTDKAMRTRKGAYPGSDFCNEDSPHALWHQETADFNFELQALAYQVDEAIQNRRRGFPFTKIDSPLTKNEDSFLRG